ncbi:MAG: hypothetical protein JXQ90_10380 [Cyclobacteriaceae bacterium]
MDDRAIDIKLGRLFPFHFQILGLVFSFIGIVLMVFSPYFSPIPMFLGGLILTGYRGIKFDGTAKVYKDYNSFLFIKFGKWEKYSQVEKVFINSSKVSQKVYTMVTNGTTIENLEYNAYIMFEDGKKLYLMSDRNRDKLYKKLARIADFFQSKINDNTMAN